MPPPRLPRHLRPCRPLWSARQVRFASDKPSDTPSTAGDDSSKSARSPEGESQTDFSFSSSGGYKTTPPSALTTKKPGVHNRNGRWKRDQLPEKPAAQTAASTGNVTYISQAQRMRKALGGNSARNATPQFTIHRPAKPQLRILRSLTAGDRDQGFSAIATSLEEKEKLQQEQRSGTSTQNEDELRARLKKLEEQLALLQAKLAAENAATAEPTPQPADTEEGMKNQEAVVEGKTHKSTPLKTPDTIHAGHSESKTVEKQSMQTRKKNGTSPNAKPTVGAGKSGGDKVGKKPSKARKPEKSSSPDTKPPVDAEKSDKETVEKASRTGKTTLAQQIQAQSTSMKSSSHPQPSQPPPQAPSTASDEVSEQSLLDELFPEASSLIQPDLPDKRPSPPKLDLPAPDTNPHIRLTLSDTRTDREKAIDSFRARGEQTTVLQLSNCSTALTESDFRRLIPRGQHIETWSSSGEFYKIIPGRDPLSLTRLPFYYLLFHSPASALAYQKNASRLSKLSALHAPSSIASAVAPPAGFLENGEDIAAVTSSFVLHPQGHNLDLRTVMQPYNRALRALIDAGGYTPIVPNIDEKGRKIYRVLLHIDGYEPSHWDLWQIISRHAHARGIIWPFRNDHASAVRRLRDAINLKTVGKQKFQAVASSNPRASSALSPPVHSAHSSEADGSVEYEDPAIASFLGPSTPSANGDGNSAKEINQLVMNRVYNRWIVEFEDEDAARRFAGLWHRVVLPDTKDRTGAWKEAEEERWVEAEYLW